MKYIQLLFLLITTGNLLSQNEILTKESLFPFIAKVDSLNADFRKLQKKDYYSNQQSNADYLRIITKTPDAFIQDLQNGTSPSLIIEKYNNAVIDRNVFITKTKNTNYKKVEKIKFQSYEIKDNGEHSVTIPFDSLTFYNHYQKGKYFYDSWYDKKEETTRIDAFFILEDFETIKLDSAIAQCIDYADLIIGNSSIFYNTNKEAPSNTDYNPLDSLNTFFNISTKRPTRLKDDSYKDYKQKLDYWHERKHHISDSLFIASQKYRTLINEAIAFAKEIKSSNSLIEFICDRYISKHKALELMRLSPIRGSCSYDAAPINQQVKICRKAAELSNWSIFIKSLINIMNDNMARGIDNSMSRATRKTYFTELEKLPIDIEKLLIGMSLRITNPSDHHHWGAGDRIGKSIANSRQDLQLTEALFRVIQSPGVDQFNKLHFYNILMNVRYFTNDKNLKEAIDIGIKENLRHLYPSLSDRINDPHLELKNLLVRDSVLLNQHFEIRSSAIGDIYTAYTDGHSWVATFKPKNNLENIVFDIIMYAGVTLGSVKKLCESKDSMIKLVRSNEIFNEFISSDTTSININYIVDKSYVEKKRCCNLEYPDAILSKYGKLFEDAIMLSTKKGRKKAQWIVFNNGDALLTQISKDFNLENYAFDQLMTKEIDKKFGRSEFYSYKVFDVEGNFIPIE